MGGRRDWLLRRFPWERSRSNPARSVPETQTASDVVSQSPTSDDDPRLIDVLKRVIALRQGGDSQGSLDLVDRSLADGMFSIYLLDNRGRALIQLNRCIEAIPIWWTLHQSKPLQYEPILTKQLVRLLNSSCRSQGWMPQCICQDIHSLELLEESILKECELLREYGYIPLIVKLIDTAGQNQFKSHVFTLVKAKALIDLQRFVDARHLLSQLKRSVKDQSILHSIEEILASLTDDVEVERVLQCVAELERNGDVDAAIMMLVESSLRRSLCLRYDNALKGLLSRTGEKYLELQIFELFLDQAEMMLASAVEAKR